MLHGVDIQTFWVRKRFCAKNSKIPAGTGMVLLWIEGDTRVESTNEQVTLSTGDLLIADSAQSMRIQGANGWSAEALYVENRHIKEFIGDRRFRSGLKSFKRDNLLEIMLQLRIVGDTLSQVTPEDQLVGMALIDLISRLSIRMVANATEARASTSVIDMVDRARGLIRVHLTDQRFGVADLAHKMRISPRHLSSLFAPFGTTVARTILEMRVERSRELLGDPVNAHRQIADIALACGFEDQSYFSRCFRAIIGQSPREFRRKKDFSAVALAQKASAI